MDGGSTEDAGGGSFAGLGGLERWWAYAGTSLWCLVLTGSVLLNFVLLVAFVRRPGLRTISNRFVMNLIVSNLLAITVLAGLLIAESTDVSFLTYSGTPSFCALSEGATALVTTSSILSVLLIGLDQYLAVVDPLRYRTRIDKLKCGLLIVTLWFIALVFGALASLNPQPRSLCHPREVSLNESNGETKLRFEASVFLDANDTDNTGLKIEGEFSFQNEARNNATREFFEESSGYSSVAATYGLVYAILYATLGYLIPFLAICWIYVKIYFAARSNSERTRRNGSRPILSSGSFSEEASITGYTHRPDASVEDFRRIPKISSLSSIDENSETCPSQMSAPQVPYPEDVEDNASRENVLTIADKPAVVFMVGSSKNDVNEDADEQQRAADDNAKESTTSKVVPISALKAKFLSDTRPGSRLGRRDSLDLVKSRFPEVPEQRRKSSHDLMYEEMMLGFGKHPYEYDDVYDFDGSSDEEEDEDDDVESGNHHHHLQLPEKHDFEEVEPLKNVDIVNAYSSARSISVNFDLSRNSHDDDTRSMDHGSDVISNHTHPGTPSHPLPIVTITPPGSKTMAATVTATSTGTPIPLHRVPSVKSTHSYINNLKYKISNGSLFKYREETRAARISALVIVMGLICWTPYVYVLVTRNLPSEYAAYSYTEMLNRNSERISRPALDATALGFLILATYISPLLFGYRSRRVKRELRKFFCFKRELSYKNNRSLMAKKVLRRRHSGATILSQFVSDSNHMEHKSRYNIFNCMYGRNRWPKEKVQFVQVPDTALAVETCRSSFSSGASTQISSTSTDEC